MTHDEQKRAAQMAGDAVRAALEVYAEMKRVPQFCEIEKMVRNTEEHTMAELSIQRIAREAGEYVAGSGIVN